MLQQYPIVIFDRKPITHYNDYLYKQQFTKQLFNLLNRKLIYDCCQLITDHIFKIHSDTIFALLNQLSTIYTENMFDLLNTEKITSHSLEKISTIFHTNLILFKPLFRPEYFGLNDFYIHTIEAYLPKNNMIIYTDFTDGDDDLTQISMYINHKHPVVHKLKDCYHEYIMSYQLVNNYVLKCNDPYFEAYFDYETDNNTFQQYDGPRYDAAIHLFTGDTYQNKQPILFKDYILRVMKLTILHEAVFVLIYEDEYYVISTLRKGIYAFVIVEFDQQGSIFVPNLTNEQLVTNYRPGNIENKIRQPIYLF